MTERTDHAAGVEIRRYWHPARRPGRCSRRWAEVLMDGELIGSVTLRHEGPGVTVITGREATGRAMTRRGLAEAVGYLREVHRSEGVASRIVGAVQRAHRELRDLGRDAVADDLAGALKLLGVG